ncbi:MAG: hypothetical protein NT056_11345 [Proteobacteria bacterium]|nr:hypothetical protein [Pseudomonadota bacterium]
MKRKSSFPKSKITVPVEIYTDEQKAEFLLSNAVDKQDYEWAVKEIIKLGLDPDKVSNRRSVKK